MKEETANGQEEHKLVRINVDIVLDMFDNYKLPERSAQSRIDKSKQQPFLIEDTIKALAHNKHNDHTTTYSLLHKKWINSTVGSADASRSKKNPEQRREDQLVTLSPENYQEVIKSIKDKHAK